MYGRYKNMHTSHSRHCEEIVILSDLRMRSRFSSKSTAESVETSDFLEGFESEMSDSEDEMDLFPTSLYGSKAGLAISSDYLNPKEYSNLFTSLTVEERDSLASLSQGIENLLQNLEEQIEPVSVGDDICAPKPVTINCTRSSLLMRRRTQEPTIRLSLPSMEL